MTDSAAGSVLEQFQSGISRFAGQEDFRIGAELKFPLVEADGSAAPREGVESLWRFLVERGWHPQGEGGRLIGATRAGECNDTVGSSETGYCKTEFSLAHVANLADLEQTLAAVRGDLEAFSEVSGLHFLGCGLHPVTPPSARLKVHKERASVWGDIFRSNECIPESEGDDTDLFTVNAGSHVHVSLPPEHVIEAVNVFNGFASAQLALGGNGSVWRDAADSSHEAAGEAFWDWWVPARGRVGVPAERFVHLDHYAKVVAGMDLLYVRRNGGPLTFPKRPTLSEFLESGHITATTPAGETTEITPEKADLELHNSCYWFNARVSRYFTVENRVNEQQPPEDLLAPAAITTGLAAALPEACEVLKRYEWKDLVRARPQAYRAGLEGEVDGRPISEFAAEMLEVATIGLARRARGEERFLDGWRSRLRHGRTPAKENRDLHRKGGAAAIVKRRSLIGS